MFRCDNTEREFNTYFAVENFTEVSKSKAYTSKVLEEPLQVLEIAHLHGSKCDALLKAPDYDLDLLLIQLDSSSHDHSPCIVDYSLQTEEL